MAYCQSFYERMHINLQAARNKSDKPIFVSKIFVGNGGDAGVVNVRYRTINGNFQLKTCAGEGAPETSNGAGGGGNEIYARLEYNILQIHSI